MRTYRNISGILAAASTAAVWGAVLAYRNDAITLTAESVMGMVFTTIGIIMCLLMGYFDLMMQEEHEEREEEPREEVRHTRIWTNMENTKIR